MTDKTLWFSREFVTLHETRPVGEQYLYVGQFRTLSSKYGVVNGGEGDPGAWDYPEFRIVGYSWTVPPAASSDRIAVYTQAGTIEYYQKWGSVRVPDNFEIPYDGSAVVTSEFQVDSFVNKLMIYAGANNSPTLQYFLSNVDAVLQARSMHDVFVEHMQVQTTLLDRALKGNITPEQLLNQSEALTGQLTQNLIFQVGMDPVSAALLQAGAAFIHNGSSYSQYADRTFIAGQFGNPNWQGGSDADVYVGTSRSERISGGNGDDILAGGAGNDVIRGMGGSDQLVGGSGHDTFLVNQYGSDTIVDFEYGSAPGDRIVIRGASTIPQFTPINQPVLRSNIASFSDVLSHSAQVGADTVITLGVDLSDSNSTSTLTLRNTLRSALDAADFQFGHFNDAQLVLNSFGADAVAGGWANNLIATRDVADVNGDGRDDIIGFGGAGTFVALGQSNGLFANPGLMLNSFGSDLSAGGWSNDNVTHRELADVNGDGRADIVGFGGAGTFVALSQSNGFFGNPILAINSFGSDANAGGWTDQNSFHREMADVNGDGRADIVGFGSDSVYVALANSNGTFSNPFVALNSFGSSAAGGGWSSQDQFTRHLGDVNGDSRADVVGFGANGVYVAFGTASGLFGSPALALNSFGAFPSAGGWINDTQFTRLVADVNNDNRADIVGFGADGVYTALSTSTVFASFPSFENPIFDLAGFGSSPSAGNWASNSGSPRMIGDINGDNANDVIGFGSSGVYAALGLDYFYI